MLALVVDDERNVRFMLREVLSKDGFEVMCAADGDEALELLRDTSFDLIVLDLRLGGRIDGIRLLRTARWRWPNSAVVILTAHASLDTAVEAIREDVDGYLLKPIEARDLLVAVHQAIDKRANLRRWSHPRSWLALCETIRPTATMRHARSSSGMSTACAPRWSPILGIRNTS